MFTNKHHIQYLSRKNLKAVAIRFFQSRETVEGFSLGHFSPENIRINALFNNIKFLLQLICSIAAVRM